MLSVKHKIESAEELVSVLDNLTDKKKEASKEKSKTYKAKERFKDIFDKAEQIRGLDDAESCYQSGDTFFEDEHNAWERLTAAEIWASLPFASVICSAASSEWM